MGMTRRFFVSTNHISNEFLHDCKNKTKTQYCPRGSAIRKSSLPYDLNNIVCCPYNNAEKASGKNSLSLVRLSNSQNPRKHLAFRIDRLRKPLITLYDTSLFSRNTLSSTLMESELRL
jgi:hypothetical protein